MPGTDTPRLSQGVFKQLNKKFVVVFDKITLDKGHYISVMDMPENCNHCYAMHISYGNMVCQAARKAVDPGKTVPDFCPLRKLPERETEMTDADDLGKDYVRGTMDGWNACLDEITG